MSVCSGSQLSHRLALKLVEIQAGSEWGSQSILVEILNLSPKLTRFSPSLSLPQFMAPCLSLVLQGEHCCNNYHLSPWLRTHIAIHLRQAHNERLKGQGFIADLVAEIQDNSLPLEFCTPQSLFPVPLHLISVLSHASFMSPFHLCLKHSF